MIILLGKPEDKSTQIEDNLEVFQKIWKSSTRYGRPPGKSGVSGLIV
jgi:hypothetical protein